MNWNEPEPPTNEFAEMVWGVVALLMIVIFVWAVSGCSEMPLNIGVQGRYSNWHYSTRDGVSVNAVMPYK